MGSVRVLRVNLMWLPPPPYHVDGSLPANFHVAPNDSARWLVSTLSLPSTTRPAWASLRRAFALMGRVTTVGTKASARTHLRDSVAIGDVAISTAATHGLLDSWHTV